MHTAQHPIQPVAREEARRPSTLPVALRPAASSDMEMSGSQNSLEAMEGASSVPLLPFRVSKGN